MLKPVGIRDVAAEAGVSVGTVSNVLNKPELVTPATVERVLKTMDDLGFVRNDLARQLKMGGGTTIGMIVHSFSNPFFGALAHACEEAAEALGHTIVLGSSDQLTEREERYVDLFEQQRVRGMILTSVGGLTPHMLRLVKRRMPLVLLDPGEEDGDFCTVAMNGVTGAQLGINHLVETGRRRLLFLGGPVHQVGDRWRGAEAAVAAQQGVTLTRLDTTEQTIDAGRAAAAVIAAMPEHERPDGIFAANDLLALGVMQALVLEPGIHVPNDVAIVGYDDIEYAASAIVPLTTIRQPLPALAGEMIRLLLDQASDPAGHVHQHVRLRPELVVRQSTPQV